MRVRYVSLFAASFVIVTLVGPAHTFGQTPPVDAKAAQGQLPKPPLDETRAVVREIEEAYKAPMEVDKDALDELRKQYKNPTPEREAKLFYEIRRLYQTTPESDQAILREVRLAYQLQSPEQEKRVFDVIRQNNKMPLGTVHPTTRIEQAGKMFRKLDQNGNGLLSPDEMTDSLRGQMARWDRNRDGAIDPAEYEAFFLSHHQTVAAAVEAGDIPIRLPKGVQGPGDAPKAEDRPFVAKHVNYPPGLPPWFAEYDTDGDGQVGLYEWRRKGRSIADFLLMDRNNDGYLTPAELLHYLEKNKTP